jgi:hypothetical protein
VGDVVEYGVSHDGQQTILGLSSRWEAENTIYTATDNAETGASDGYMIRAQIVKSNVWCPSRARERRPYYSWVGKTARPQPGIILIQAHLQQQHSRSPRARSGIIPRPVLAGFLTMAAMMPSASTSNAVYDNDAVERDLIDPDDGECILRTMPCNTRLTTRSHPRRPR